jgi:ABC-type bacteriocin/lantibiotic exporter with double-glycine peptidase domain
MFKKNNNNENNYLFYKIIFMRPHYKFYIFLTSIIATIFSLMVPYYQKILLDNLLKINTFLIQNSFYKCLFFMFIFSFLSQLLFFFGKFLSYGESNYIKKWLSDITYSKALRLKNDNKNKLSVGQSLSIYANDIHTASTLMDEVFPNIMSYVLPILMAPIAIIFILEMNPSLIFCLIFSILFLNFSFAFRQSKFFFKSKLHSSNRLSYVNEWIQNIRIIRTLGWTRVIEKKIQDLRIAETKNRLQMVTNGTTMNSIGYSAPFFVNILSVYILVKVKGNDISAGQIFSLLWIFGVLLTRPMRMLPIMLVSFSDCFTSLKRIQSYWNQNLEEKSVTYSPEFDSNIKSNIVIKNLSYKIDGMLLLDNINLEIKSNEFIAIIGEIGSGKSLILQAILNIIKVNYSEFKINNKPVEEMSLSQIRSYFCYVPQDYFIINSNLRDNVAFEYNASPHQDQRILDCLELSQFDIKNENMRFGLDTEIGERGVNLSGGQKQRVAIARACFSDRPIILLDDCLSALDVNTEDKINEVLFNSVWKNKIRILVTHRLSILSKCDKVLFIRNGKIIENGSFNEIYNRSESVRDFVSSISP